MGRFTAGVTKVLDWLSAGRLGAEYKERFREAVALQGTDEADEGKYRRLTKASRDLTPLKFSQIMDGSFYLWQRNPLARRLVEIVLDFTVGNDLEVKIRVMKKTEDGPKDQKNAVPQDLWNKFCDDPVNQFYEDVDLFLQDFLIFGELLLPVALNEVNSLPRLGFIDVGTITKVKRDASGRRFDTVYVQTENSGHDTPVKVINYDAGKWEGEAFYFQHSRTLTKERGQSFLTELLDWIDGLDQFQFNALEGSALRNAFFWDMTVKGADEKKLKEMKASAESSPPKPATVRMHNDMVTWDVIQPELNAADVEQTSRTFKNNILGGKGIPEHFLADGGNTNLATASAMGIPFMQMMRRHQKRFENIIRTIARYVVEVQAPGNYTLADDEYLDIEVVTVDLERADAAVLGNAFTSIVGALSTATSNGWVSDDKAKQIVDTIITRYGVTPDEDTVESIRERNKAGQEEDDAVYVEDLLDKTGGKNGSRRIPVKGYAS